VRRDVLLGLVADTDGLIVRNRTRVDEELLARAPRLRVVGRLGVGLDNIDVAACRARGIAVIPATGANALAVAEYVIGTTMLLLRGAYGATAEVASGSWPRAALSNGRETAGKTLGIVGFGGIGRLVARLAQGLGMRVIAFDPLLRPNDPAWTESGVGRRTLEQLLAESDAVTLHVPLLPETRHLIDAGWIAAMRPGAVLINTARGGVVDEPALAAALRAGRLAGASLDVFEHEPLPAGSVLAGVPNLLLTPHIAGVTVESNRRVSELIAEKVIEALKGRGA
jgi:(S)-sulfolactate dehydrogenase